MTQERKDLAKSELGMVMGMTYREYHREYQRKYRREKHDKCIAISRAYRQRKAAERGPITAVCAVCGKTFVKTGHFQVCCSAACRRARKNEKERARSRSNVHLHLSPSPSPSPSVCPTCGKTFTAKTSRAKFCSLKCHHAFFNGQRKGPTQTKTCPICGKVFETTRQNKMYCSKKCLKKSKYKPVGPRDLVCAFCGKPFTAKASRAKYCSQLCASRRNSGYATLADFEKAKAARKAAAHVMRTERDRNGLTLAQIQEVISAQDGDPSQLWRRSQHWTDAQRKYARKRYEENHGLFSQSYNP